MRWAIEDRELFEIVRDELNKEYLFRERKAKQDESDHWAVRASQMMRAIEALEELEKRMSEKKSLT